MGMMSPFISRVGRPKFGAVPMCARTNPGYTDYVDS